MKIRDYSPKNFESRLCMWKDYEISVGEYLKSAFPGCTIELNVQIEGKLSGFRQIDTIIRFPFNSKEYFAIVQAKEYKRNVDIIILDQFIRVIEDTGAAFGIIVTKNGFTKQAIKYANSYKRLQLLTLNQTNINSIMLPILWVQYNLELRVSFTFRANGTMNEDTKIGMDLNKLLIDGEETTVSEYFISLWKNGNISKIPGKQSMVIEPQDAKIEFKGTTQTWLHDITKIEYSWNNERRSRLIKIPADTVVHEQNTNGKTQVFIGAEIKDIEKLPYENISNPFEFKRLIQGVYIESDPVINLMNNMEFGLKRVK